MNPERKLKVGVIGVGALGQWHARVYSELPQAELVGVYDVHEPRAEEIAARYRTRAFKSMEALAAETEALSVVVPSDLHCAIANTLMNKGVHLLVEKPIASSTVDAQAMVALAEEKGLVLQVGHVERFNPVLGALEQVLTEPRFIEAVRLAPYPPPREGLHPRGTEVSVVLDLMIHDLEIILHLVRSPVRHLHAVGVSVLSPSEDIANVRLSFENGCVANVTASRISSERTRKIRVFQQDTYVSLDYEKQSGHLFRKTGAAIERSDVPIEKGEPLFNELSSFVQCVLTRGQPKVSGQHAALALKLAVEICTHIRQGGS
ncbi:MAG: Gfo/Idh/MocA family oxidoreductase [bacterium]